ncbi:hypothetical protein Tco_1246420 [Tanacetum coccineum]
MFRSVSTSRVLDDSYYTHSPTSKAVSPALRALALEANELPQYETSSFPSTPKKDKLGRARLSEKAVHLIPLVLMLCALVLWFLSNPDINMPKNNDSFGDKIKRNEVEGDVDSLNLIHIQSSQADADFGISKHKDVKKLATSIGN